MKFKLEKIKHKIMDYFVINILLLISIFLIYIQIVLINNSFKSNNSAFNIIPLIIFLITSIISLFAIKYSPDFKFTINKNIEFNEKNINNSNAVLMNNFKEEGIRIIIDNISDKNFNIKSLRLMIPEKDKKDELYLQTQSNGRTKIQEKSVILPNSTYSILLSNNIDTSHYTIVIKLKWIIFTKKIRIYYYLETNKYPNNGKYIDINEMKKIPISTRYRN